MKRNKFVSVTVTHSCFDCSGSFRFFLISKCRALSSPLDIVIAIKANFNVVFKDGPLGFKMNAATPGAKFAQVLEVIPGGQAAIGGVEVDDIIVASDFGTLTITELMSAVQSRPRPLVMAFRRPPPPLKREMKRAALARWA